MAWWTRLEAAYTEMRARLEDLEARLAEHAWLSGECFGLADLSRVVRS